MQKRIRGAGGASSGETRTPIEAPDSLRSIAYAKILDIISEGEIIGFNDQDNPLTCAFFNETPVENADGSRNFHNFQIESTTGTQTQDYIRNFEGVESETAVGVELEYGTPWTHSFTNLSLSAVRVRLSVLALSKTNTKNGDVTGHKVDYKIEVATDGGSFVELLVNAFNGKASSKYERSHRIDLPAATVSGWIVRVTRTTTNATTATIQDTTMIESYAEVVDGKFRMPMTALVGVIVDASQFNSIPSRSYLMRGRVIKVPSNYDPETRLYTGVWDGTFITAYSNNPAWVFYDMAINNRYGLGHILLTNMIDKWALYTIGVYCDELVDDGKGGTEPRFTCNLYLQTRQEALRVMQNLATVFRGIMYATGGAIAAVADMPDDPIYTYTRANVIDGKFVYTGSAGKVRHTVALVTWNDMADFGRAKVEYVEDEEGIARYGIQQTETIAIGCTSQGQARRHGKHILATERYETDAVSFSVGLDGTFAAPGKIIRVADPLRAGRRIGGRLSAYSAGVATLDHADTVVAGDTLICILPTGLPESREVDSVAGNDLTLVSPFSADPAPQSVWAVENVSLTTQRYRVISVAERREGLGYTITALQHVEGKYDYIENDLAIQEPSVTALEMLLPPMTVNLSAFERVSSALPVLVFVAEWDEVVDAAKYEISIQRNNGVWSSPVKVEGNRYELEGVPPGIYIASIRSISHTGFTSIQSLSVATTIQTPNFTIVNNLVSVANVVTIDCSIGEQFKLVLVEDVDDVVFENVSSETTLIIEIQNTGNYYITFPVQVVAVSGTPYEATTGGTVLNPKIDTIGLHTDNAGVSWQLRADLDDNPAAGGGTGAFSVSVTPNPAYDYSASNPSLALTATVVGGAGAVTVLWTRAPGGVGDWDGSATNVGGVTDFTCSSDTSLTPTFSRTGTADGYVAQNWRIVATDSLGNICQAIVEITLEDDGLFVGGSGGVTCPWGEAFLFDGRKAKDVKVGTRIVGVDPVTLERRLLVVSYSKPAMAPCVTMYFADGTELSASRTAPIPTPDGLVPAPDMLGLQTITGARGVAGFQWAEVVSVVDAGVLPVQHITAENGCFMVGNKMGKYMAHHNIKWYPDAPGTGIYV